MSSFSETALLGRLAALTNSQQSIQTMSLWLIHHKKHAKKIVKVWYMELKQATINRKLVFIYLANDVVQTAKKKGSEFTKEFSTVIDKAFIHVLETCENDKSTKALARVLSVWAERSVFNSQLITRMTLALSGESPPPSKKQKRGEGHHHRHHHHRHRGFRKPSPEAESPGEEPVPKQEPFVEKIEALSELLKEEEDEQLEEDEEFDPEELPEADEIVQALNDMDNSASSDATVREQIAKLPPEVQDASLLDKIQDQADANKLLTCVDDACVLLDDYNVRLALELEDRTHVMKMLKIYRISQHQKLKSAEDKLKGYQEKLRKAKSVRKDLASHIQNLPDLTLLPDVTGGLAPLPSAGDLFSM